MRMKKSSILTAVLLSLATLSLSSCDDEEIANTLEGTWKGDMYISSEWDGRYYDATYTEITFLKDPYAFSSGTGYWVDYYSDAPWDYVANRPNYTGYHWGYDNLSHFNSNSRGAADSQSTNKKPVRVIRTRN